MRRPRVLMLGWEFPPLINGGLGIACLGLGRALAKKVDLSFILPKTEPSYAVDQVELIGLNNLSSNDYREVQKMPEYEAIASVDFIPTEILPYSTTDPVTLEQNSTVAKVAPETELSQINAEDLQIFASDNLYGADVNEKVAKYARVAAQIASRKNFDIVHAHDWMTFLAGVEIKKQNGKPLFLHVHSLSYDRGGPDSRGEVYDLERYAMEQADVVISVSQYTRSICIGHYGIDPGKVLHVHNGADPVEAFRTPKPFPEKLVLFLGRITGQKGPEYFLEIAAKVLESNKNVRFVMAGTGERLRKMIEYGAFRDVGDRLHFTGFLDKTKVNLLLSMTDVYCMPSVSEPFGLSALEAAQFGIPAVISKQSGVAEVLTLARKADYWDVELMAKHILELLTDDAAHERAMAASLQDQQNCTWDHCASQVVEFYQEAMAREAP